MYYSIHKTVKRTRSKIKRLLTAFAAAALFILPLASIGLAEALTVHWNPNGNYVLRFTCVTGCSGDYDHDATISGFSGGNYNISGGYLAGSPHTYAWSGTGNVNGNSLTNSVNYTLGAIGTHMDMTGTIAPDGTMSGGWTDNNSGTRTGTWKTISGAAFASSIKDFNWQSKVLCTNTIGKAIVNVTENIKNDADSGTGGNSWALDNYTRHIKVWATGPAVDGKTPYCATVTYDGNFKTIAGKSPQYATTGGTVGAGISGGFDGGYVANFNGTFSTSRTPNWPTNGSVGTVDYMCNTNPSCPGKVDWTGVYFTGVGVSFTQPWWGWIYDTCQNGSWVNSIEGNAGDIVGNAPNSSKKFKCHDDRSHESHDSDHESNSHRDDDKDHGHHHLDTSG